MKSFDELNDAELKELKEHYYCDNHNDVSYDELANIDDYVSYEELKAEYGGMSFSPDDFFSTFENEDEETLDDPFEVLGFDKETELEKLHSNDEYEM